jgi:hypothetical protein
MVSAIWNPHKGYCSRLVYGKDEKHD